MESTTLAAIWKEHLALIAALVSALFIAVKILSVANYDPATAYGILQAGGATTVIIGATLPFIGSLSVIIASFAIVYYDEVVNDDKHVASNIIIGIGVLFSFISVLASPVPMVILLLALFLDRIKGRAFLRKAERAIDTAADDPEQLERVRLDIEKYRRRIRAIEPFLRRVPLFLICMAAILVAGIALSEGPWLPAEKLYVKNSPDVIGYILSDSGSYMAVLTSQKRQIVYIPSSLVIGRSVCNDGSNPRWLESFHDIFGPSRYPPC